jgi:hypothetical protein
MEPVLINEVARVREELAKIVNNLARIARLLEDRRPSSSVIQE